MTRPLLIGCAVIAPLLSLALIGTNVYFALAPIFASHLLLLYATLVPNCQWWGPVMTTFATAEREVWITIDDGPSPAHTTKDSRPPRAVRCARDLLRRWRESGGTSASYHRNSRARTRARQSHADAPERFVLVRRVRKKIKSEIDRCAETSPDYAGTAGAPFRAPAGMKNPFVHPALARRGLALVGWTVRGLDTIQREPERVARRIEKRAQPGAIILLHEGQRRREGS